MDNFNETQPIYQQLIQKLIRRIIRGDMEPGEKMPSVRETALQFKVNPNTVQRAYAELERLAVVETRRGLGTFVTEDKTLLERLREKLKGEKIAAFIAEMREMGFGQREIMDGLKEKLRGNI